MPSNPLNQTLGMCRALHISAAQTRLICVYYIYLFNCLTLLGQTPSKTDWSVQNWPTNSVIISDISIGPAGKQVSRSLYPGHDTNGLWIANGPDGRTYLFSYTGITIQRFGLGYNSITQDLIIDSNLPTRTQYIFPSNNDWPRAWEPSNQKHTGNYLVSSVNTNNTPAITKFGIIDRYGELIIPLLFTNLQNPADETTGNRVATVMGGSGNLQGVIDQRGKWIIEPKYTSITVPDKEGIRVASITNSLGLTVQGTIHPNGNWKLNPPTWTIIPWPTNNIEMIDISVGDTYFDIPGQRTINKASSLSLYPGYDINGNKIATSTTGKSKLILPEDNPSSFHSPQVLYTSITQDLITDSNLPARSDYVFASGNDWPRAWEPSNQKHTGNYLVSFQNTTATKFGVINGKGEIIVPLQFTAIQNPAASDGTRIATVTDANGNSKQGVIDQSGEWIIDPKFTTITNPAASDGTRTATFTNPNNNVLIRLIVYGNGHWIPSD